ncbi:MAG: aminopeptidase, partial [Anaerococcus obesiensis]
MTEYKRKNVWENLSQDQEKELESLSKDYMDFLDKGKTERLAAKEIINLAKKAGYVDLEEKIKTGKINSGDKIYAVNKNKAVAMFHIGSEDLSEGLAIVGGHIDSPRLDLKPVPLTEENGLAYLKTHYYGGVKKYNWTNMPLALHGVVFTKNGEKVDISIGDKEDEPVFFISELLIHLSRQLMEKSAKEVITGEQLSIIVGNRPLLDEKENPVKKNILKILNEKYGIEEEDFITAELEVVPAGKAREVGFDKSMIAAHGHDDRVCSYAALRALLDIKESKKTLVGLFVDKEEIGSVGATGMTSQFFENTLLEIMNLKEEFDLIKFKRALRNSKVLSADVTLAEDPNFK